MGCKWKKKKAWQRSASCIIIILLAAAAAIRLGNLHHVPCRARASLSHSSLGSFSGDGNRIWCVILRVWGEKGRVRSEATAAPSSPFFWVLLRTIRPTTQYHLVLHFRHTLRVSEIASSAFYVAWAKKGKDSMYSTCTRALFLTNVRKTMVRKKTLKGMA